MSQDKATDQSKFTDLKFSYEQVLDATKHQDDKIGRFLTAIAFLSASAFAMANLSNSKFLTSKFFFSSNEGIDLPLITLLVYFLGVLITILLLMSSFATPLKFPSLEAKDGTKLKNPYGSSTLYFNEIASETPNEWFERWEGPHQKILRNEKFSLLVETYNLSLRIRTKYSRMNEAIAVFSFSVLGLAITIVCVAIAAIRSNSADVITVLTRVKGESVTKVSTTSPKLEVAMDLHVRWILGFTFVIFILVQLYGIHQSNMQLVDRASHEASSRWLFLAYSLAVAYSLWALCVLGQSFRDRLILYISLFSCDLVYLVISLFTLRKKGEIFEVRMNDGKLKSRELLKNSVEYDWSKKVFRWKAGLSLALGLMTVFLLKHSTFGWRYMFAALLTALVVARGAFQSFFKVKRDNYFYDEMLLEPRANIFWEENDF